MIPDDEVITDMLITPLKNEEPKRDASLLIKSTDYVHASTKRSKTNNDRLFKNKAHLQYILNAQPSKKSTQLKDQQTLRTFNELRDLES